MANAWGDAWGTSWGDAWGEVELVWLDVSAASSIWTDPEPQQATLTLTRASTAFQYDGSSYSQLAANVLRDDHSVTANDGNTYTTTLLEDEQENLLKQSSAISDSPTTPWIFRENFGIDAAVSVIDGQTAYRHFNNTGNNSNRRQIVGTLSGSPETLTVVVENISSDRITWGIFDQDANTWVLRYRYLYDGSENGPLREFDGAGTDGGADAISMGTGPNGGDLWRVSLTGTPDNQGNERRIAVYPARDGTAGILHHAQHVESPTQSSLIVTGSSSATRKADNASDDFQPPPQEMTVYVDMVDLGSADASRGVFMIGPSDGVTDPNFHLGIDSIGRARLLHENGMQSDVTLGVPVSYADRAEFVCELHTDGSVTLRQWLNDGAEVSGTDTTAPGLPGAWADTKIWINARGQASSTRGFAGFMKIVILAGTKSRAECRAADQGSADVLWIYDNTPVTWSASAASTTWTDA